MITLWSLVLGLYTPPPPPTPLWEEVQPGEVTYRMHRWMGYGILTGSIVQLGLGWMALSAYERGDLPPDGVRITHRVLGYTVGSLAVANAVLGTWNLLSIKSGQRRRKHYLHATLSWLATGGYVLAGILAYQARTRPDFDRYRIHRNAALTAVGATVLTVGVIIW